MRLLINSGKKYALGNPEGSGLFRQQFGLSKRPSIRILYPRHDSIYNDSDFVAYLIYEILVKSDKYEKVGFDRRDGFDIYDDEQVRREIEKTDCVIIIVLSEDSLDISGEHPHFFDELKMCVKSIQVGEKEKSRFLPFIICKTREKEDIKKTTQKIKEKIQLNTDNGSIEAYENLIFERWSVIVCKPETESIIDMESRHMYKQTIAKELKNKSLIDVIPGVSKPFWKLFNR